MGDDDLSQGCLTEAFFEGRDVSIRGENLLGVRPSELGLKVLCELAIVTRGFVVHACSLFARYNSVTFLLNCEVLNRLLSHPT